ncbi:MAG: FliM/FliN family flagellar motor switch protein [Candidatus Latescibacterota bacterium]|uniref:Flagellar motor switch protein FliN-like C-terminal domain-containing protein n=1 Tax=marine metagenome TaxID=408172 RepID=A0A382VSX9_9ZZZZ|nr:FliM/FliN family flagellar motor switch protein [Candidatus Latescibacterota bacterium]
MNQDSNENPKPPLMSGSMSGLSGVKVKVTAVLGRTQITFDEAIAFEPDMLLPIDSDRDEPVDLCVNGKVVARGRLVVVGDTYGVQVTEIIGVA